MSHPSIRATVTFFAQRFVWPTIGTELKIAYLASVIKSVDTLGLPREIVACRTYASSTFISTWLGLLRNKEVINRFSTTVDRYSHWPAAYLIEDTNTEKVVNTFLNRWILQFGVPTTIATDRGPQFQSNLFKDFLRVLCIRHIKTKHTIHRQMVW